MAILNRRIGRDVAAQLAATVFNALVSFALLAYLARLMGADGFGGYAATLSFAVVVLVLIEGGWPTLLYRETAGTEGAHREFAGRALAWVAVRHIIVVTVVAAGAAAMANTEYVALPVALACMGTVGFANLVSARLRTRGAFVADALWQAGCRAMSAVVITVAVLSWGARPSTVFVTWGLSLVLPGILVGWRVLRPQRDAAGTFTGKDALPFVAMEAGTALLLKGDVALAQAWGLAGSDLSLYGVCTRINEFGLLLFAAFSNILFREFLMAAPDSERFRRLRNACVCSAIALGGFAVLASRLLGPVVMPAIFGESFLASASLLQWTCLALPFAFANLVWVPILLAQRRERQLLACLATALAVLVAGMGVGVQMAEAQGVAISVVAAQAALFVGAWLAAREKAHP